MLGVTEVCLAIFLYRICFSMGQLKCKFDPVWTLVEVVCLSALSLLCVSSCFRIARILAILFPDVVFVLTLA